MPFAPRFEAVLGTQPPVDASNVSVESFDVTFLSHALTSLKGAPLFVSLRCLVFVILHRDSLCSPVLFLRRTYAFRHLASNDATLVPLAVSTAQQSF